MSSVEDLLAHKKYDEAIELLELDRTTLDDISIRHPRVSSVVADFYDQRAGSDLERDARSR